MSTLDPGRRAWLRAGAALGAAPATALAVSDPVVPAAPALSPAALARDAGYWKSVAALYDVTGDVAMLDNGFWGAMATPVLREYQRQLERVNHGNAYYGRLQFPAEFEAARLATATALGVEVDEIVLTRGATEALQALIGGYNRLRAGDAVLCADVDYDNMITTMGWLRTRRGVDVVQIAMPEPATHQSLIDRYAQAMDSQPRLRLILLTHVNHRNGMVMPVAEITRMAKARGIGVIVDAAHSIGQLDMQLADLGADFVGINLHKWIGAPVGVGAIYVRRGHLDEIDPYMGETDRGDIRTRIHTGTLNFAAYLALPLALRIHARIGVANKQARLHRLRNRWVEAARGIDGIEVLASNDPRLTSAIASFRLRGKTSVADNVALSKRLLKEHGVFAVMRDGLASGACVRVTPGIFTLESQVDRLVTALRG